ncbi:dioxygenase family protein [Muricoccus pecuniae]|uniref:Protocatechuate 3,4-dioxygenase beta subunit n=1 Tax=Muricoccus pecuniae TaxID=693023 RepID=A0A840Y507_9PROT|nr:dioxygenase [Roseomonas pecuniae]MBB5696208.1 protocatechuate 3,4-dioxygenase beta subunit [Roseomonas pecuniae]
MADLNQETLTDAVVAQMASTPDPRLRKVMESLVRHLHAFAREVRLTPAEWLAAIGFLTRVGQTCTPIRQEFILLSDTLGLSRLVNLMDDQANRVGEATETSLLGPFYREASPQFAYGESIAKHAQGPEMMLFGRVMNEAGEGVPNAIVEIWQTDADGAYDLQALDPETMDMRGQFRTDAEGRYAIRTLIPLGYSIPMDGPVGALVRAQNRHGFRPAHIHMLIGAEGYRELVTALYLGDDANIDSDTVFGVSESLVVRPQMGAEGSPSPDLPSVRYDFQVARKAAHDKSGRVGADPSKIAAE